MAEKHDEQSARADAGKHANAYERGLQCCVGIIIQDALGFVPTSKVEERNQLIRVSRVCLCFGPDMAEVGSLAGVEGDKLRAWAMGQREFGWPDAIAHPGDFAGA